jgi:hypothetical protein
MLFNGEISNDQMARTKKEFEKIAKEELNVSFIDGSFIAKGSELACLRLERAYKTKRARAMYAPNLTSWVFILDIEEWQGE